MRDNRTNGIGKALVAAALVVLVACSSEAPPPTEASPAVETPQVAPGRCFPVKVAILQDQTGSAKWTRTQQMTVEELDPLLDLLRVCGGELGFGLIRDRSNRSLLRLRIEAPPARLAAPPKERNPLKNAEVQAEYERKLADNQASLRRWNSRTEAAITRFRDELEPLLSQGLAGTSDVLNALRRADLFLAETPPNWTEVHLWLVAISDGVDNVGAPPVALASGANSIVVNGSASLGVFESLNPLRYESVGPALLKIVESVEAARKVAGSDTVEETR